MNEINMKQKALFPGTFDPFTRGHDDLVRRALLFCDEIVIAVGINAGKKTCFTLEDRLRNIEMIYAEEKRVTVTSYDVMTTDFAKNIQASFILRGVRNATDFEFEKDMACINRRLNNVDTVILVSNPAYAHIRSSFVRELIYYKKDISGFIPETSNLIPATK
jgi:pantetheine-phosphate adenylyltransferase